MSLVDDDLVGWVQCKHSVYHTKDTPPMRIKPELQTQTLQVLGYACQVQALSWIKADFPERCRPAGADSLRKTTTSAKWLEVQNEEPFSPLEKSITLQE